MRGQLTGFLSEESLNKKTPARSELALSDWVRVEEPGFYWV
jgi:hypothetical protein